MAQKVGRNVVCTFLCPNREASATIDVVSRSYFLNENMIDTWSRIRICVVTSKLFFRYSKYAKERFCLNSCIFQKCIKQYFFYQKQAFFKSTNYHVKFVFSKKASKIEEIFTVYFMQLLHNIKSTVNISLIFVAFLEKWTLKEER